MKAAVYLGKEDLPVQEVAAPSLGVGLKDTVAVIGAGPIGIMHAMLARLQGAQKVLVLDNHPARLEMARRFDLDAAILVQAGGTHREEVRALTGGLGPEVVTPRCARAR